MVAGSTTYPGEWLEFSLPKLSSIVIKAYQIYTRPNFLGRGPYKFVILATNNGLTWTVIDSRNGIDNWTGNGFVFCIPNNTVAGYAYRLSVQATWSDPWLSIGEMKYFT